MKKVFINFTDYSNGEWTSIHYVGTDYQTSVQEFKKNLKESLSIGPDDQHSFNLVYVNLRNKDYDKLIELINSETDVNDFMKYLIDEYDLYSKVVCCDDNSGNYEIINLYCEENNLDVDDDDVYQEVWDLFCGQNEDLYNTYIDRYIESNF
jgi:hypothetical protein